MNKNDDSRKPTLEGLDELHQLLHKKSLSQAHFLFLAVYVIAVHSGFIPQNFLTNQLKNLVPLESWTTFHKKNVELCCSQPPTYQYDPPHETFFTQNFITNVKAAQEDILKSVLTAIVTGDFMVITLTPHCSTQLPGRSICLSIGRYVISHSVDERTIDGCYQKLDQLRLQLRNELFVPMRSDQLLLINAFPQPNLMGVPRELRFRIYKYLLPGERHKLRRVNKTILEEINGCIAGF